MLPTYQQIISCDQLHKLIFSSTTSTKNSIDSSSALIVLDASIPPVGKMNSPEKKWPYFTLPNSHRFDLNKEFSDLSNPLPHSMPSAEHFQKQVNALGITCDSQIVVYDDQGLFSSARAWYMFKSMGHKNIAVLNGGLPAWLDAGFSVSSAVTKTTGSNSGCSNNYTANFSAGYFCNSQEVHKQLLSGEQVVVDARAAARFEGKVAEPRKGIRSGHMPNSKNLPFSELLANGMLLSKNSLKDKFHLINPENKPMLMSCGSGVTACVLALAAEVCGYQQVKVYDGSWSEWGADLQLPVVTGK